MFSPADPASFIQDKQEFNQDLQVLESTDKEAIRRPLRLDLKGLCERPHLNLERSTHCTQVKS